MLFFWILQLYESMQNEKSYFNYGCFGSLIGKIILVECLSYKFAVWFNEQLFWRMNFKASSDSKVLILLTINTIVSV